MLFCSGSYERIYFDKLMAICDAAGFVEQFEAKALMIVFLRGALESVSPTQSIGVDVQYTASRK